jgi:hypothetical protein
VQLEETLKKEGKDQDRIESELAKLMKISKVKNEIFRGTKNL